MDNVLGSGWSGYVLYGVCIMSVLFGVGGVYGLLVYVIEL